MSENLKGGFFLTRTVYLVNIVANEMQLCKLLLLLLLLLDAPLLLLTSAFSFFISLLSVVTQAWSKNCCIRFLQTRWPMCGPSNSITVHAVA